MMYNILYQELKQAFNSLDNQIEVENLSLRIRKMDFQSDSINNMFEESLSSNELLKNNFDSSCIPSTCLLNNLNDGEIQENASFNYYIFENTGTENPSGVIFLFHGLNEKKWDKYLTWAYRLANQTGKTVILFPLAFHMNRAPFAWSETRLMNLVSQSRSNNKTNSHSSFVNAALSERLEILPQRFFWSGYQSYADFIKMTQLIHSGKITGIKNHVSIDLFGYSIGAFFSLLLLLDNPNNLLQNSRLFIFCGGATNDRAYPVSKYIIDKNAHQSVANYYEEFFQNKSLAEKKMDHYFSPLNPKQSHFGCVMNYKHFRDLREKRLSEIHERINAIVLEQDDVMRPREVTATLKGESGNIKTNVRTMDFEYPHTHIAPFPSGKKHESIVDESFKRVFEQASSFLA